MKALLLAAAVCMCIVLGATLVGRAVDHEMQDRVIFTQNGVTLDCERITDVAGRTFYDSCERVP